MKKYVGPGKVLLFFLAIFIVGSVLYYFFNPKKAINLILPDFTEISHIHIDLKKDSALVKLFVLVQNKMPYKMVIDSIHFEIKLNNFTMADEIIPVLIDQSRFDTDTIELPIHLSLKENNKIIGNLLGQDSTDLDISFYVLYDTFLGNQKIHFNRKVRIATPVPIQISIFSLEHKEYHMKDKNSEAVLKIGVINKGENIDLQLDTIRYNLQIDNTLLSNGIFAQTVDIKPASSLMIDIPIIIEYNKPLKTAWLIATDNDMLKYNLNIQSDVIVNIFETPYLIPVEIDATGTMELVMKKSKGK